MMLDLMLEADLEALDGRGESELASHLRECLRCRAIAHQLQRDTASLAQAVASTNVVALEPPRPRRRSVITTARLSVAGLAAALVVFVAREPHSNPVALAPVMVKSVATVAVQPSLTAPSVPVRTQPSSVVLRTVTKPMAKGRGSLLASRGAGGAPVRALGAVATAPAAVSVEPMTPLDPVAPVRLVAAPTDSSLGARVAVDPPAGVRASVMRTSTPGVTVVWLYQ
jgi:hypothetical protein